MSTQPTNLLIGLFEQSLDLIILVGIVALYVLRDQGLLVLSQDTMLLLWGLHAGARGITKNVKAAQQKVPTLVVGERVETTFEASGTKGGGV